jgi:glycosyltransferase involved in cell wall biosynthesis
MNVLFTRFPLESRFGGAEVQTLALMKGLRKRGHEVTFLGSCPVLLEETTKLKIENGELVLSAVEGLNIGPPPVTKWHAMSFAWRGCFMKKKLHVQCSMFHEQFDAVVMLSLSEKLLLTPYFHARGTRVIWVEHDRVGHWLTHNPWLRRLKKLSRMATTVVVSDLSKGIYDHLGFAHVIAIPNGVDASRLGNHNEQTSKRANEQTFHIGTLARLSYDKGVDVLIDAVKDLSDVSLTIIGTGKDELAVQTAALALPRGCVLPKTENLREFYEGLELFVLPSREHDPFGLVAAEAMALGIPTIVTDACGIAGYLTHDRDAMIVAAGSVDALRSAIVELKKDNEKRSLMGAIGKWTAEEKFSIERMVDCYEKQLRTKMEN